MAANDAIAPERPFPGSITVSGLFVLNLVDAKNAMNVIPGTFFARGHD